MNFHFDQLFDTPDRQWVTFEWVDLKTNKPKVYNAKWLVEAPEFWEKLKASKDGSDIQGTDILGYSTSGVFMGGFGG